MRCSWAIRTVQNTPWLVNTLWYGTKSGPSMFRRKFAHFYGEHAQTAYQLGTISIGDGLVCSHIAKSASTGLKQWATSCGNVHWHEMCGLFLKAGLRSAATQPQISSSFFSNCNWKWTSTSWKGGQSRRGQSGMQEIDYTSSTSRLTQRWFLSLQADWSQNTNVYSTHTELTTVTYSSIGSFISSLEPNARICSGLYSFFQINESLLSFDLQKKKKKILFKWIIICKSWRE